ncbi:MAG: DUF2530 domain-containing protein, partial [Pseudonocardiaceae bacterium]
MHPFDVDGVRTVAVGTVLWAAAFVVLALNRTRLDEQGLGWWLWTCLAGVGLGLLGLEYTRKRRDAIAQALLDEEADRPDEAPDGPDDDAVRSDEPAVWQDAEPAAVDQTGERPPMGRRARRGTSTDAEEISESGT